MSQGGYEQILAVSPRDARWFRLSEQLIMIFGVMTLLLVFFSLVLWVQGSAKVPLRQMLFLIGPFPLACALSVWIHRRIARRHGLL